MPQFPFSQAMTANQLGFNPLSGWQYEYLRWPRQVFVLPSRQWVESQLVGRHSLREWKLWHWLLSSSPRFIPLCVDWWTAIFRPLNRQSNTVGTIALPPTAIRRSNVCVDRIKSHDIILLLRRRHLRLRHPLRPNRTNRTHSRPARPPLRLAAPRRQGSGASCSYALSLARPFEPTEPTFLLRVSEMNYLHGKSLKGIRSPQSSPQSLDICGVHPSPAP